MGRRRCLLLVSAFALCGAAHADSCGTTKAGCMPMAPVTKTFGKLNATECCNECQLMAGCRAWSVVFDHGQATCQLSSHEAPLDKKIGNCTSGVVRPTPPVPAVRPAPPGAKNVLLIVVDDLRPELNATYGASFVSTPNMDRLGARGTTFTRAYCQQAICGPSRNSFLTGRRPQRTQVSCVRVRGPCGC